MDRLTPRERSALMSRIRGRGTRPEALVGAILRRMEIKFNSHSKALPGTPDFSVVRHRVAIFVHGCFWHRHPGCKDSAKPRTRVRFWRRKFEVNMRRDWKVQRRLRRMGWRVLTVWECKLKRPELVERRLRQFLDLRAEGGSPGRRS